MAEFPIDSNDRRAQYGASAGQTAFPYDFPIFAESEITVYRTRAGATSTLALATDYAVSGVGAEAGGNVTLAAGALAGDVITILGTMPNARSTDFQEQGDFRAEVINRELDRLTIQIQELRSKLGRAVRQPDSDGADIATLPPQAARAGMLLGFDANGDPTTQVAALPGALTALAMPRVNAGASAYELRTPGEVLGDIGAQPLDATLSAFGALAIAADTLPYGTGADAFATAPLSAFARSVLDDPDAPAARTTLGLGTLATQSAAAVAITGGAATFSGAVVLAADPTAALQAATKQYVDGALAGLGKRGAVRLATTANINLATGGLASGAAIDGATLATGDLVLVKAQTAQAENGIYVVPAAGAAARDANYDAWAELPGALIAVAEGATLSDTLWLCTSNSGGTLGTSAVTWSQVFPGSGGTVTNIATAGLATGGPITSTGTITVDINALAEDAAPAPAVDFVVTYDASVAGHKKVRLQTIAVPVGMVSDFAGATAPAGWLLCFGQAVSRTTYAALFAVISTTFGAGDGSTTFNLPDLRGRASIGKDNMGGTAAARVTSAVSGVDGATLGASGGDQRMQSHTHSYTRAATGTVGGGASPNSNIPTGDTTGTAGAGNSQNMQPSIVLNKIIFAGA